MCANFVVDKQKFRMGQIESMFRQQKKCDSKIDFFFWRGGEGRGRVENILGNGENAG